MKWKKYTIATTAAACDFISAMLAEAGIEGIEIEDRIALTEEETREMFVDIMPENLLPDSLPDDGSARISFYLDAEEAPEKNALTLDVIREGLREIASYVEAGSLEIIEGETDEEDWLNNWKKYFHPFYVDDILIKPTWEEVPEGSSHSLLISIDPGAAFGTGSHETTRLCIRSIRKYLHDGDRVLDIGTGSGILSIVALRSGASSALGTDLDPCAITAAAENAAVNGIEEERFRIVKGNIIDDEAVEEEAGYMYDMGCANILAPAIIALAPVMAGHLKPGGVFIVSGIIDDKEQAVKEAFAADPAWELLETGYDGEWVSMTYRRH